MTKKEIILPVKAQKVLASVGTALFFAGQTLTAHADQLTDTTKNSGSKVMVFLIIVTIVLASISAALGIAMMASGNQMLHSSGMKKLLTGLAALVGILVLGLIVTWIYQTVTSAGGGTGWTWPI